jgi:hypothetical protein
MSKKYQHITLLFLVAISFGFTQGIQAQQMCSMVTALCTPGTSSCCPGLMCLAISDTTGTCIVPPNDL